MSGPHERRTRRSYNSLEVIGDRRVSQDFLASLTLPCLLAAYYTLQYYKPLRHRCFTTTHYRLANTYTGPFQFRYLLGISAKSNYLSRLFFKLILPSILFFFGPSPPIHNQVINMNWRNGYIPQNGYKRATRQAPHTT